MCWTQPYTRHRRRQARQITLHYMCWTQPYTRHRTTKSQTNNTTLYVLDTTIHKTLDADKQDLCYLSCLSSSCVLCMAVSNTYSVVLFVLFVIVCVFCNVCWTQTYTRHRTTSNKTNNTTLYVLDTTIHKTQDNDKQDK
jgi:hypothetical protein